MIEREDSFGGAGGFVWDDPANLLREAFDAAVRAADPSSAALPHLPDPPRGRLVVVGAGKAAAKMALAAEGLYIGETAVEGLVIVPDGHGAAPTRAVEVVEASHPVPDERGVAATERILDLVSACGSDDRVLVLLSGGGSALLCAPDGLELAEKAELTRQLLRSGAGIVEMNAVRKHLSRVKGGRLALAAGGAPVTALVLSDVVGDDLASIASGPTVADPSTFGDALAVLDRYGVASGATRAVLESGTRGERPETPKPGDPRLTGVETRLIGSNQQSLEAAAEVVRQAGWEPHILSSTFEGSSRETAGAHAAIARQVLRASQPFGTPCALLSGGETTVKVTGGGRGGRNGEFLLALALALPSDAPVWALAADTDGRDGSEDNAGALLTPGLLGTMERAAAADMLERHDSYSFFADAGHLLVTGPTGTNVNDLRIVLLGPPPPRR